MPACQGRVQRKSYLHEFSRKSPVQLHLVHRGADSGFVLHQFSRKFSCSAEFFVHIAKASTLIVRPPFKQRAFRIPGSYLNGAATKP